MRNLNVGFLLSFEVKVKLKQHLSMNLLSSKVTSLAHTSNSTVTRSKGALSTHRRHCFHRPNYKLEREAYKKVTVLAHSIHRSRYKVVPILSFEVFVGKLNLIPHKVYLFLSQDCKKTLNNDNKQEFKQGDIS